MDGRVAFHLRVSATSSVTLGSLFRIKIKASSPHRPNHQRHAPQPPSAHLQRRHTHIKEDKQQKSGSSRTQKSPHTHTHKHLHFVIIRTHTHTQSPHIVHKTPSSCCSPLLTPPPFFLKTPCSRRALDGAVERGGGRLASRLDQLLGDLCARLARELPSLDRDLLHRRVRRHLLVRGGRLLEALRRE